MARRRRDDGPKLDRPGQPPLLQGRLKAGGLRAGDSAGISAGEQASKPPGEDSIADQASFEISAQPAEDIASSPNQADVISGKATKSPADVATRPHLEGSEQGPA